MKKTTLSFLERDAQKSSCLTPQISGWNPTNAPTDEWEMSECDHSLQNQLSLDYNTHRQRWHSLNQHCARQEEDGWLPFYSISVYGWGWVHTHTEAHLNPLSGRDEFWAWLKWISGLKIEIFCVLLSSLLLFIQISFFTHWLFVTPCFWSTLKGIITPNWTFCHYLLTLVTNLFQFFVY